jgi:YVTN family beta-propeller protein
MKRSPIPVRPTRPTLIGAMLLILAAASLGLAQQPAAPQDQPFYRVKPTADGANRPQRFEKEGIAIDFSVKPLAGDPAKNARLVAGSDAQVTFRVTDSHTGQPVGGLRPSAWISSRALAHTPDEAECKDKIGTFLGGLLAARPEINLNAYYLLTLNHDNTITFINPQISFLTKLESIVTLPGLGADWVLSKGKDTLYVTLPEQSQVVAINMLTRKIVAALAVGEKAQPMRVALQPDGRYVWVGLDGSANVAAIDTATNRVAAIVPAGKGLHNMAFAEDSRYLYVTNSKDDTVSAIDTQRLAKVADIKVAQTPVPIAYSRASRLLYVAGINGSAISIIDPSKQQTVASIPVKRGVVALRFDPEGRHGFAVNQIDSAVSIIDAATNAVTLTSPVVKGADQVTFTGRYAYIRGTESEQFSLIDLGEARKGKLAPTTIQAGQKPPSASPADIGVADMIVPAPEGNAVMIANAPDQVIYYYTEGLMAPSGTIDNYKRRPRALMLLDNSLTEVTPGTYTVSVRLRRGGRFDVPMLIDQPRISNCFQLEVADSPAAERQKARTAIAAEALFKDQQFKPGEPVRLTYRILDSITREPVAGLRDVHVLAFEPPGIWQQRQFAREIAKGVYEVTQVFPEAGLYRVMVQVESHDVRYVDLPYTEIGVIDNPRPQAGGSISRQEDTKHD